MFRSLSGFKAQYHYLTLLAVSEFDEWKVLVSAPGITIHGARQFGEVKAKDHALGIARQYIHDEKHADLPVLESVDWAPTGPDDWLVWRS
ncbi:MAG: hypothetical protein HY822_14325 [Acidobacteria bacterium]|nr:hypothetical protein [Acidobacteriota bacterium]